MSWWQETTIYQVYPRSFADSNGDGVGDLRGVIDRLDHLVDLGAGTVWLSPFFASPQRDWGYDVTDHCAVAPEYGTLADVDELLEEAHARGLRVMFDLVLNHTSDEHPWFVESRSSRTNPRADWYVWADGGGRRRRPNNWRTAMEIPSAWQWGEERQQWYLASFLPFQPDLNWRNPEVKAAMFDVVRFWLRRGVDGFRLDMFGSIMKDPALRSNPFRPGMLGGLPRLWLPVHTRNRPENVALARELRAVCDEFDPPERVLLGEVFGSPAELRAYLAEGDGLQLVFLFDFLTYRYSAAWLRRTIARFESAFPPPLQPTYVLENHDRSRTVDRVGGDEEKARVLACVLLTARGVPTIYQGQELGMRNTYIPLREARDPVARVFRFIPEALNRRIPERPNRDEVRTPMQWDGTANAGFCPEGVEPWLPVNPDHTRRNVAAQRDDPSSMLALYRGLLRLRRDHAALRAGTLHLLDERHVLAYERRHDSGDVLVAANLEDHPAALPVGTGARLLLATRGDVELDGPALRLPPHRAAVVAPGRT